MLFNLVIPFLKTHMIHLQTLSKFFEVLKNFIFEFYNNLINLFEFLLKEFLRILKIIIGFVRGIYNEISFIFSLSNLFRVSIFTVFTCKIICKFQMILGFAFSADTIDIANQILTFAESINIFVMSYISQVFSFIKENNTTSIKNIFLEKELLDLKKEISDKDVLTKSMISEFNEEYLKIKTIFSKESSELRSKVDLLQEKCNSLKSQNDDLINTLNQKKQTTQIDRILSSASLLSSGVNIAFQLFNFSFSVYKGLKYGLDPAPASSVEVSNITVKLNTILKMLGNNQVRNIQEVAGQRRAAQAAYTSATETTTDVVVEEVGETATSDNITDVISTNEAAIIPAAKNLNILRDLSVTGGKQFDLDDYRNL